MAKPKYKAEYGLAKVKALIKSPVTRRIVKPAVEGAQTLDLGVKDIVAVVNTLTTSDYRFTIASEHDHTLWLDVYHPFCQVTLYVKFYIERLEELRLVDGEENVILSVL
jgi:motility quorum-sensing regulator/GCU-specific mRNA interferase toxin